MGNTATSVKKYQNLLFPVMAILIGLVVLGLVIIPQGLKIPETNSQIDQIRKNVNSLNQKITQLNGVNLDQYKQDLNSSLMALPEDKDIPGAMILVLNLLKNNSITLNGISFSGQEIVAGGSNQLLVKLDVAGSKDSLTNLIDQLKHSPRVMKVETLTTTTSASSTAMQILIGLDTFYQPIPKSQALDLDKPVELPSEKNRQTLQTIKEYQAQSLALTAEASSSASVPLGKVDPFQ